VAKRQYSIARARDRLTQLVHDAERGEPIELTRRGKLVAVIVSVEDFQRIPAPEPKSFEEFVEKWRASMTPEELEELNSDDIYRDVRDRSPGRDFSFPEE
jgi:prevent-host-death family protein